MCIISGFVFVLWRSCNEEYQGFFGHAVRREELENLMVMGMVEGTRGRGRQSVKYLDGLVKLARGNVTGGQFVRATRDRR